MATDQPVTVDHGDLLEVLQAAEAWASRLRELSSVSLPHGIRDYEKAADRIDKAIRSCRREAWESTHA